MEYRYMVTREWLNFSMVIMEAAGSLYLFPSAAPPCSNNCVCFGRNSQPAPSDRYSKKQYGNRRTGINVFISWPCSRVSG